MNQEIKEQWVTALRSGEYEQGRGNLCWSSNNGKTYCCLGVLSDLAVKAGIARWSRDTFGDIVVGDQRDGTVPVEAILDWAGLDKGETNHHPIGILIGMNDGMSDGTRKNFVEIADWIEENL